MDCEYLSDETEGLSGSDLRELCRSAAILRVRELMRISETERSVNNTEEILILNVLAQRLYFVCNCSIIDICICPL